MRAFQVQPHLGDWPRRMCRRRRQPSSSIEETEAVPSTHHAASPLVVARHGRALSVRKPAKAKVAQTLHSAIGNALDAAMVRRPLAVFAMARFPADLPASSQARQARFAKRRSARPAVRSVGTWQELLAAVSGRLDDHASSPKDLRWVSIGCRPVGSYSCTPIQQRSSCAMVLRCAAPSGLQLSHAELDQNRLAKVGLACCSCTTSTSLQICVGNKAKD